jgi:hypothetical protein
LFPKEEQLITAVAGINGKGKAYEHFAAASLSRLW